MAAATKGPWRGWGPTEFLIKMLEMADEPCKFTTCLMPDAWTAVAMPTDFSSDKIAKEHCTFETLRDRR